MSVLHSCFSAAGPIAPVTPSGAQLGGESAAAQKGPVALPSSAGPGSGRPLHRLAEVRRQERLEPHTLARRLGISTKQVREQEQPAADMRLSDLYRWQDALGVPASELLEESGCNLSRPTKTRATLVRVMKTVRSIQEEARQSSIRRLEMLADELLGIMPELEGSVAWPTTGRRRRGKRSGPGLFPRHRPRCDQRSGLVRRLTKGGKACTQ